MLSIVTIFISIKVVLIIRSIRDKNYIKKVDKTNLFLHNNLKLNKNVVSKYFHIIGFIKKLMLGILVAGLYEKSQF